MSVSGQVGVKKGIIVITKPLYQSKHRYLCHLKNKRKRESFICSIEKYNRLRERERERERARVC